MKMAAIAIAVLLSGSALADVDFEGISGQVPSGYEGFEWSADFYALDADNYSTDSGYKVMGSYVGYNAWEASPVSFWTDGHEFDVFGLDLITAWYTWTTYRLEGLKDGAVVYSGDFTVGADRVSHIDLGYVGIDQFRFTTIDSSYIQYWDGGSGTHFAVDNIVTIPAPGALALLGLAGLTSRRRR